MGLIDKDDAVVHLGRVVEATTNNNGTYDEGFIDALEFCIATLSTMPTAQPEQTKMIEEIREWINSGNRGSADYFIVDKIEEILNRYE